MKLQIKIDDNDYHNTLYFVGINALELAILDLSEKYFGKKTKGKIEQILRIKEDNGGF